MTKYNIFFYNFNNMESLKKDIEKINDELKSLIIRLEFIDNKEKYLELFNFTYNKFKKNLININNKIDNDNSEYFFSEELPSPNIKKIILKKKEEENKKKKIIKKI